MSTLRIGIRIGLTLSIVLAVCSARAHGQKTPSADLPEPKILAAFDIAKHGDEIVVPVRLNGRAYPFLFDTGCSTHVFDLSLSGDLGPKVGTARVLTPDLDGRVPYYESPSLLLGECDVSNMSYVSRASVQSSAGQEGNDYVGMLGSPALKRHVVRVDFDRGRFEVLESTPARASWGDRIPLERGSGAFEVVVETAAGPERFTLDTGCAGVAIRESLAKRLGSHVTPTGTQSFVTAFRSHKFPTHKLDSLAVGPFRVEEINVMETRMNLLGLSFLRRFKVVLDVANNAMYLTPGEHFTRGDDVDHAGLELRVGKRVRVARVKHGGPAEAAGIRPGDFVTHINGVDVNKLGFFEVRWVLGSPPGTKVRLECERGKTVCEEVTIELADD